ncbi:MAG: lysophospholipid acyltransferase family protein [Kiritimatiellia bacterium]
MKMIAYIEYLLLAGFWWFYKLVPVMKAYAFGRGIGVAVFSLFSWSERVHVAVDNVVVAGVAKTRREARHIARESFGHFIGHISEAIRASDIITRENWRNYVDIEMSAECQEMLFRPQCPLLLATGHLGAWEAGITAVSSERPMFAVARLMDNPYIQQFLDRHNFRGGITILPKKHGFSGSLMRRWQSENGALTILFDQYSSRGVLVPFFGQVVPVYTSPARIHLQTGAPILVGGFLRTGPLHYKLVTIGKALVYKPTSNREKDIAEITANLIRRLEVLIRMAPEQYLWVHRRWRGIPVPSVPEK